MRDDLDLNVSFNWNSEERDVLERVEPDEVSRVVDVEREIKHA